MQKVRLHKMEVSLKPTLSFFLNSNSIDDGVLPMRWHPHVSIVGIQFVEVRVCSILEESQVLEPI